MKKNRKLRMIFAAAVLSHALHLTACSGWAAGREAAKQESESAPGQSLDEQSAGGKQSPGEQSPEEQHGGERRNSEGQEDSQSQNPEDFQVQEAPRMTREEYPVVDGSTATIPLSTALYQLVTGASPEEAQGAVQHTKTTNAYMRLLGGGADLVIAYEPAQSVYDYMETNDQKLIIKPIGKDALVFMANAGNPVSSLSGRQLVDIYTGRYRNWSEVGGDGKEIVAFQRPQGSGSQTLMEKLVMKGVPMVQAPQSYVVGEMGELIEKVASYDNQENALGYSVYFYARNMYQKPELTFMAVDGVMPDNETIKKGTYPYVNEFYAAVRLDEPEDSRAYQLFQWLTTQEGQRFVESLGYVGMEDTARAAEPVWPQPDIKPGTVNLEQGARLLLDKGYLDGTEGVVVLGEDLSVEQTITDKTIDPTAQAVAGDEPVIMTDLETMKQGLYVVEENRWAVEPVYDFLSFEEEKVYYGYRDDNPRWIAWDQEQLRWREASGRFFRVEDCWWREEEGIFEIFQGPEFPGENETSFKTLDFSGKGFSYSYEMRGRCIAVFLGGGAQVLDERGELLFDMEQAVSGQEGDLYDITPRAVRIGLWDNDDSYVYNFVEGRFVTEPGDQVGGSIVCGGRGYFSVMRDGKRFICDEEGNPVCSGEGRLYDRFLGDQYCGSWADGVLYIEKPGTEEHYEIPRAEDTGGIWIAGSLFYLNGGQSGQKPAIYRGNERLMEDEFLGCSQWEDYSIIYGPEGEFVVDGEGKTLWEGTENQHFLGIYAGCLMVVRGNYICLMDGDGNCGFQALSGHMADD